MEHMLDLLARHGITRGRRQPALPPRQDPHATSATAPTSASRLHYNVEEELLGTAGGVGAFRELFARRHLSGHQRRRAHRRRPHRLPRRAPAHRGHRHPGRQARRRPVALRRRRRRPRRARVRLPGEAAARRGAVGRLQLPASTRSSRRSSTTSRPARSSTGPRTSSRRLLADDVPFHRWVLDGYWNDVGNIEQYRLGNFDALMGRVDVEVPGRRRAQGRLGGRGHADRRRRARSRRRSSSARAVSSRPERELIGPLIVGDGCVIERGAVLEGVINWDGVKAGRNSRVAGSILGNHVVVHHEAVVHEDAVIGDRSDVAAHTAVPAGARLEPRTRLTPEGPAADRSSPEAWAADDRERHRRRPARPRAAQALRACGTAGAWLCDECAARPAATAGGALPALRRAGPRSLRLPAPVRSGRAGALSPAAHGGTRRLTCPAAGAVRSAAAATSPSPRPRPPSPTRGRPGPWSPPASSAPCARSRDDMVERAARRLRSGRRRTPSSPGCPGTATTSSSAASTRPSGWRAGLRARPGSPMLRLLRRTRHGARQSGLDRAARAANVQRRVRVAGGCKRGTEKAQASDDR